MSSKDSQILQNLKSNENFNSFLRGSIFIKYPTVTANDATTAFIKGRNTMKDRLFQAGQISNAQILENILNTAAASASFTTALEKMTGKILTRMLEKGQEGISSGVDSVNISDYISYRGGTSFARKITSFSQAYSVWQYGKKKGIQYTEISGAIGGGTYGNAEEGSAYDFLYKLNNGLLKEDEIEKLAKGFYDVSNLNGEILERIIEAVGATCFREGSSFGAEQTANLLNAISSMDVSNKTVGQQSRHVSLNLGDKTGAIVYDSQGKVDAQIQIPDLKGAVNTMNISAKSVGRLSSEVKLLTGGNFMGLIAGVGLSDKKSYSSLTVYTGGGLYSEASAPDTFKEMLLYQAMAGSTFLENDFADYMVFQVGDTSNVTDKLHFRVIPMSALLNSGKIKLLDYAKFKFQPNPLPIGANTYIQKYNRERLKSPSSVKEYKYPRTEETFNRLFNARISVLLRSGFLKQIFNTAIVG